MRSVFPGTADQREKVVRGLRERQHGDGPEAVLAALRARRTVAYDELGRAHGDPALIRLLGDAVTGPDTRLRRVLAGLSAVCGWLGLLGSLMLGGRR